MVQNKNQTLCGREGIPGKYGRGQVLEDHDTAVSACEELINIMQRLIRSYQFSEKHCA
jgi:hypothetical protein